MLGFCAISDAPISDLGNQSVYASAQVSAFAEVNAFASVFYDVSGNIVGYADVIASPNAVYWGYANVNGTAEVTALAQNVSSAIAYIYSEATVGAYANTVFSFTADINAEADVTANAFSIHFSDAAITCFANVTVISGDVYSAKAQVNGYAYVTGLANASYTGYGIINANATITANGNIIGEGWTPVTPGAETWSDITPSSDIWVTASSSTDTWEDITSQNFYNGGDYKAFGLYDYPQINNVSVKPNTTIVVMNSTNNNSLVGDNSSSGIAKWSDNTSFQPVNYVENENNGNLTPDYLWVSYYQNNVAINNDTIYANTAFNGDYYWISFANILIGNSAPPALYDKNKNNTSSDIYATQLSYELHNVTNIGSQYLAVGYQYFYTIAKTASFILKSTNAINWNEISSIEDVDNCRYYNVLTSGSNYAIAAHNSDNLETFFVSSPDGTNFTLQDSFSPLASNYTGVYGDKYVVISNTSNPRYVYTSNDGITWTQTDISSTFDSGFKFNNIIWDGLQYVLAGRLGANSMISTSADGITWTPLEIIYTSSSPNFTVYNSIAYSGSEYLFITNLTNFSTNVKTLIPFTSPDLVTWTQQSNISNGTDLQITSLIYANGQYTFVGGAGVLFASNAIMNSADGITWTRTDISSFNSYLRQIIWTGNQYIAVGNTYDETFEFLQPSIITSLDGVNWTASNIQTKPAILKNTASGSQVIVPPQGIAILCSSVGLYYPDRDLYTSSNLTEAEIDIIMGAAVSPLNITSITDTSNLTWIKRSYVLTPYTTEAPLVPAIAQEIWYAINNTNEPITSSPTITYADVFDAQTVSLTSWSGVNLDTPFNNLIPGTNIWTAINPSADTWLRQG